MEFILKDGRVGLSISEANISVMLKYITKSGRKETGGILVGYYTSDQRQAVVSKVTGPPKDSSSGTHWFMRGIFGLKELLNIAWKKNQYYLGEWHYHPMAIAVEPSGRDLSQMQQIACSHDYQCPEPIMIIIAGNPKSYIIGSFLTVHRTRTTTKMISVAKCSE